jgi:uncharacterized cupredoxin-like copper-binding protein
MKNFVILPVLMLLAAPAYAQDAPKRIEITLDSFKYVPNRIVLQHGETYVLHFTNASRGGHDFVATDFFAAARVDPRDASKVGKGEVELNGGKSVDIRLTAPAAAGTYKVHCAHFMHSAFGMTGDIVVN